MRIFICIILLLQIGSSCFANDLFEFAKNIASKTNPAEVKNPIETLIEKIDSLSKDEAIPAEKMLGACYYLSKLLDAKNLETSGGVNATQEYKSLFGLDQMALFLEKLSGLNSKFDFNQSKIDNFSIFLMDLNLEAIKEIEALISNSGFTYDENLINTAVAIRTFNHNIMAGKFGFSNSATIEQATLITKQIAANVIKTYTNLDFFASLTIPDNLLYVGEEKEHLLIYRIIAATAFYYKNVSTNIDDDAKKTIAKALRVDINDVNEILDLGYVKDGLQKSEIYLTPEDMKVKTSEVSFEPDKNTPSATESKISLQDEELKTCKPLPEPKVDKSIILKTEKHQQLSEYYLQTKKHAKMDVATELLYIIDDIKKNPLNHSQKSKLKDAILEVRDLIDSPDKGEKVTLPDEKEELIKLTKKYLGLVLDIQSHESSSDHITKAKSALRNLKEDLKKHMVDTAKELKSNLESDLDKYLKYPNTPADPKKPRFTRKDLAMNLINFYTATQIYRPDLDIIVYRRKDGVWKNDHANNIVYMDSGDKEDLVDYSSDKYQKKPGILGKYTSWYFNNEQIEHIFEKVGVESLVHLEQLPLDTANFIRNKYNIDRVRDSVRKMWLPMYQLLVTSYLYAKENNILDKYFNNAFPTDLHCTDSLVSSIQSWLKVYIDSKSDDFDIYLQNLLRNTAKEIIDGENIFINNKAENLIEYWLVRRYISENKDQFKQQSFKEGFFNDPKMILAYLEKDQLEKIQNWKKDFVEEVTKAIEDGAKERILLEFKKRNSYDMDSNIAVKIFYALMAHEIKRWHFFFTTDQDLYVAFKIADNGKTMEQVVEADIEDIEIATYQKALKIDGKKHLLLKEYLEYKYDVYLDSLKAY